MQSIKESENGVVIVSEQARSVAYILQIENYATRWPESLLNGFDQ